MPPIKRQPPSSCSVCSTPHVLVSLGSPVGGICSAKCVPISQDSVLSVDCFPGTSVSHHCYILHDSLNFGQLVFIPYDLLLQKMLMMLDTQDVINLQQYQYSHINQKQNEKKKLILSTTTEFLRTCRISN
jgi:hypothetical protein